MYFKLDLILYYMIGRKKKKTATIRIQSITVTVDHGINSQYLTFLVVTVFFLIIVFLVLYVTQRHWKAIRGYHKG